MRFFCRTISRTWLLLASLAALPLLVSCTSDPVSVTPEPRGTVAIVVRDANTLEPLNNVRVQLIGKGSASTSSSGRVSFSRVRAGNHFVRIRKNGYEHSQHNLTVGTAGTEAVAAVNVTATLPLLRTGATVSGRLLLQPQNAPDTTAIVPAEDVVIELQMTPGVGATFVTPIRTATTDSAGRFTFEDLPELSSYALTIPEFSRDGKTFSLTVAQNSGGLFVGQEFEYANLVLTPIITGSLQVFARSTLLLPNQPMVLEFSHPVDTVLSGGPAAFNLQTSTDGFSFTNVEASQSWNGELTVLSVAPSSGTWLTANTYQIQLNGVRDTTGRSLPFTTINATPAAP